LLAVLVLAFLLRFLILNSPSRVLARKLVYALDGHVAVHILVLEELGQYALSRTAFV
jgi:hypothetical protein